jgi:hypothetical protein
MRNGKKLTRSIVVLLACTLFALFAVAQSTTDGAIGGTVFDQTQALVPGAKITVVNTGTNFETSVTSDEFGKFRAMRLQPGLYTVTAEAGNFAPSRVSNVVVEVGRVTELELTLAAGAKTEVVEVTGEAPVINTLQQDFSANINQTSINELPINGRRWSNFALLTPGATPDGNYGLISFRGISGLLNNSTVDGGDNNQAFFSEERGRTRISYVISQSAVREFQVNASNFSAEYGRAAGAVVNSVTKSGTNAYHGQAFYYIRDNKWGATNPFTVITERNDDGEYVTSPLKPADRRQQFGGNIGGALVKDKLFFFFNYDQQKRNYPAIAATANPSFFATPTAAELTTVKRVMPGGTAGTTDAEALAAFNEGLDYIAAFTGEVERKGDQTIFFPKLDYRVNDKHTLALSYNRMRWDAPAGVQSQPVVSRGIASFGNDYVKVDSFIARLSSAVTNNISNEFRLQWGRDFEFQKSQAPAAGEPTTGPFGNSPQIAVASSSNGITFGLPNFLERNKYPDERRWQAASSTTWVKGKHVLKFGMDVNRVDDTMDSLYNGGGSYSYSYRDSFIADYLIWANGYSAVNRGYSSFSQAFGPSAWKFRTWDQAYFVQDDWRVLPRLTLNLGVRYEYQMLPSPQVPNELVPATGVFPSDKNNFGPRFGFAWDPWGDGKTSLRGGYGIYYGRITNSAISNAITNTATENSQRSFSWSSTAAGAPIFPNVQPVAPTTVGDIVVFSANAQNPQIHQADLIFEREIAPNTMFSLSYLMSAGHQLPNFIDMNLKEPTSSVTYAFVDGPYEGQTLSVPLFRERLDTRYGRLTNIVTNVNSNYNALVAQVNRRMTSGLQFQVNYTWAKSLDNGQNSTTFTSSNAVLSPYPLSYVLNLGTDNEQYQLLKDGERGVSGFDIRHRFVASVVWSPDYFRNSNKFVRGALRGWTISPIVSITSGRPFTEYVSGNAPSGNGMNQVPSSCTSCLGLMGAGGSQRLPFLQRNSFRYDGTENVDMRISRRIQITEGQRLELLAEAFNLFNHVNVTELANRLYGTGTAKAGNTWGLPVGTPYLSTDATFASPTAAGNTIFRERQVQLAIRYEF